MLSEMIAPCSHFVAYYENCSNRQNLSSVLLKVEGFSGARVTHNFVCNFAAGQLSSSSPANRVSRTARTTAQKVFIDYFYKTRELNFADAEHISKNSPHFLQRMLSKIDGDEDVSKNLNKFLNYNPVNEFEPFFESIGLSPKEFDSLLPQNLIFLSDDPLLLENFQVLCNYGIPRSKMGKIYKEAKEIFRFENGFLATKLLAYESLDLSKSSVIKLVCCCPSLLVDGSVDCDLVKVLEKLNRLGIKDNYIRLFLSSDESYNWKRMLDTMDFLENVGYSEEQLLRLLKTKPGLVLQGSGKKIYVWFGRLLKLGLNMSEIYTLFVQNPQILLEKCADNLLRGVDILFDIGMNDEEVANIVSRYTQVLCLCSLKGPGRVFKELNIKKAHLLQVIREDPIKFFSLTSKTLKINRQEVYTNAFRKSEKTMFLLRLGFVENSDEMMRALKKFRGRGDQLQERFDCLVRAGLDCNVVSNMVKQVPMILNQSKDVIKKKIDFLINILGYPVESFVESPSYLCYDMERIYRRFRMYVWLKDKGTAKPMLSLSTILACSDARFVKYFVDIHPEGPAMWESLRNIDFNQRITD